MQVGTAVPRIRLRICVLDKSSQQVVRDRRWVGGWLGRCRIAVVDQGAGLVVVLHHVI